LFTKRRIPTNHISRSRELEKKCRHHWRIEGKLQQTRSVLKRKNIAEEGGTLGLRVKKEQEIIG
jgi:hypothetical protein